MHFRFKQFTIRQDNSAMKVGTDGVLLGAWATLPVGTAGNDTLHILDIGTGTGLIAIMMAQRFSEAIIDAVDIDADAVDEARLNAGFSPFSMRINIFLCSLQEYVPNKEYDLIVCNPPFFKNSLHCPDSRRTDARHSESLPLTELMNHASRIMSLNGRISIVLPYDMRANADTAAVFAGLFPAAACPVRTARGKFPKRIVLDYTRQPVAFEQHPEIIIGSDAYKRLTSDFYLDAD